MIDPTPSHLLGFRSDSALGSLRVDGVEALRPVQPRSDEDQSGQQQDGEEDPYRASVRVSLSDEARRQVEAQADDPEPDEVADSEEADTEQGTPQGPTGEPLSREEVVVVRDLQKRDQEVRAHEQAHVGASRGLAGAPVYEYERGPDGQSYAVEGHVSIDTAPGRTPEQTLSKARAIRAAALAPGDPSGQDKQVAAQATRMEQDALRQVAAEREASVQAETEDGETTSPSRTDPTATAGFLSTDTLARESAADDWPTGVRRRAAAAYALVASL